MTDAVNNGGGSTDTDFDLTVAGFRRFLVLGSSRTAFGAAARSYLQPVEFYLLALYETLDGEDKKLKPYYKAAVEVLDGMDKFVHSEDLPYPLLPIQVLSAFGAHAEAFTLLDSSEKFLQYVSTRCNYRWPDEFQKLKRKSFSTGLNRHILLWYTSPRSILSKASGDRSALEKQNAQVQDTVAKIADFYKHKKVNGWTHQDVLRMAHVPSSYATSIGAFVSAQFEKSLTAALDKFEEKCAEVHENGVNPEGDGKSNAAKAELVRAQNEAVLSFLKALNRITTSTDSQEIARLIDQHPDISIKHIPTKWLNDHEVSYSLLHRMTIKELLDILPSYTARGLLTEDPSSAHVNLVLDRLKSDLKDSNVQPARLFHVWKKYFIGDWTRRQRYRCKEGDIPRPLQVITGALEDAFCESFANVEPLQKKLVIGFDVRVCMRQGGVAGMSYVNANNIAGMISMIPLRSESNAFQPSFFAFAKAPGGHSLKALDLKPQQTLAQITKRIEQEEPNAVVPIPAALVSKTEKILAGQEPPSAFIVFTSAPSEDPKEVAAHFSQLKEALDKPCYKGTRVIICYFLTGYLPQSVWAALKDTSNILVITGYSLGVVEVIRRFVMHKF